MITIKLDQGWPTCGPFYGIAQHFSLHHDSVPVEIMWAC